MNSPASIRYRVPQGVAAILVVVMLACAAAAETKGTAGKENRSGFLQAFFERSDLDGARAGAKQALRQNPRDVDALFVEMEAAALEADTPAELDAAVRLLELHGAQNDDRVAIAAAKVNDLAANTRDFLAVLARIQTILKSPHAQANLLRAALVKAAVDGLPGLNVQQTAREAGLLANWRVAGPFGEYPNLDFTRVFSPQHDQLMGGASDGRKIELFRFDDGVFRLPDYFGRNGVLYAMSEANGGGEFVLRVESPGTLEIFVDGASVLRQDSRFRLTPTTSAQTVKLGPGTHKVLVKFLAKALPFRVSLSRAQGATSPSRTIANSLEAQYVAAARKYWDGDAGGAIAGFQQLRATRDSVAAGWMLYAAWMRAEPNAPEGSALLNEIVRRSPEALAAEYELAERANAADRTDEAVAHLEKVLSKRELFVPAHDLMGKIALRMHWPFRATQALEILLNIHPSCDVLRRAQRFFAGYARYDRSRKIDDDLSQCAGDTLAYANSLTDTGRHNEAASAAQRVVAQNPLDRDAREFLARELALAGRSAEALAAIQQLAEMSPNSDRYRRMAQATKQDAMSLLDDSETSKHAFEADPFYRRYRRDGIEMVKSTAERKFSGGPAVKVLDDQVARLWADGSVSVYVHRVTRALDRGGVEKYGEVEVPSGAEILELRTIRADGTVVEPELTAHKTTISMPGLLPGDSVDEEYVIHFDGPGGIDAHTSAFTHTFGSFRAPVLYSRMVVLTPASERQTIQASSTAPGLTESRSGDTHVRTWEKNDIAQSVEEVASAKGDILPTVRITRTLERGWEDVRDPAREVAVDVTRAGPRVLAAAREVRGANDDATARALYRLVTTTLRSNTTEFGDDTPAAEETLASGTGSRTSALLALARATGIRAELVLARNTGTLGNGVLTPAADMYARPLVRFRLRDAQGSTHDVVVDAETDGLAFGSLPPAVARNDSLLVTLPDETHNASVEAAILRLPQGRTNDESVARAEVTIENNGDLRADITILLGAWRGSQMRGILAGIEKSQRGHFYQQLAARIFPGAENVTGEARNEENPERSLELVVHCSATKFANLARGTAELEQLVPTLGLKKMYANSASRLFPLYVDTPMFETATFRIHLPGGVEITRQAKDVQVENEFGKYSVTFREPEPGVLEVRRAFDIPVQIVPAKKFAEFARFAAQIDDAERQKIGLGVERASAGGK